MQIVCLNVGGGPYDLKACFILRRKAQGGERPPLPFLLPAALPLPAAARGGGGDRWGGVLLATDLFLLATLMAALSSCSANGTLYAYAHQGRPVKSARGRLRECEGRLRGRAVTMVCV